MLSLVGCGGGFSALPLHSVRPKALKMKEMDKKPNYMTVPAALKELEKIEMVRLTDNVYHLDHAVTAMQKTILEAFGLDVANIKYRAAKISKELKEAGSR